MGKLDLRLLGTPVVRHADVDLSFPTRKALALLVYLTVEGGRHSRDKLCALFWPESDRKHARAMLRYTLTSLRHALSDHASSPHLVIDGDSVGLDFSPGVGIDLHTLQEHDRLAELEPAPELWRGDFLEGFSLADAPDFDQWVGLHRERWRQRIDRTLDRLSQHRLDRGELAEAIDLSQRWVNLSPFNEEGHRRLMTAYLAAGNRTGALRAFEGCRALLEQELHIAPEPATQALAERICGAVRFGSITAEAAPRSTRPGQPVRLEAPLVGRADEFTRLVERYHAARQGQSAAVLLLGEPGIGKTRLAQEFLAWAAGHGADVLTGRAFETSGRLPFQPLVDALRQRLERENAPEDLLSDVWLTELARLLPELRDRYPDLPPAAGDETAARTRLFEAMARLGLALAQRTPVVLFVDDVQWADAGSLDALHYLGRRSRESGTALLLVLSLRSEALADTPALDEWLVAMRRDVAPLEVSLGPLTIDDTARLVQGFGAGVQQLSRIEPFKHQLERLAAWLFTQTGGQPFFLVETIRELLERGALAWHVGESGEYHIDPRPGLADPAALGNVMPLSIRELIRARLAHLSRAARELLAAAAVLGQDFSFEQVSRVAGLSEDVALQAMDSLSAAHLVREAGTDSGEFTHDKIRDVVYADAGDARQRVFHRRALAVLQATAPAAQLARHALAAGLEEPAVQFSVEAGDLAMRLLASRDALAHYDRALIIAERHDWTARMADLHARRGRAYASMASWPEARRELQTALENLGPDDREQRANIIVDLLEVCWWLLDVASLRRWAVEALELANVLARGDVETAASGWLAAAVGADGDVTACVTQCERTVARSRQLGIAPPPPVYTYLPLSLYWLGRLHDAVEMGEEGARAAREAKHTTATMWSLPHLGLALASQGRYEEAMRVFDEARRFGREYGVDTLLARAIAMSAGLHLDVWDLDRHQALAEEARDLARSLGFAPPAVSAGIDLLLNFARRTAVENAEPLIEEVAQAVAKASGWHGWLWGLRLAQARAELALARSDADEALDWAGQAIEQSRARRRVKYEVLGLTTRARALVSLGRTKEAVSDVRRAVDVARPVGDPALYLRPLAQLLVLDGDDALAAEAGLAIQRIRATLPQAEMRRNFEAAEPVRLAMKLAGSNSSEHAPPQPTRAAR